MFGELLGKVVQLSPVEDALTIGFAARDDPRARTQRQQHRVCLPRLAAVDAELTRGHQPGAPVDDLDAFPDQPGPDVDGLRRWRGPGSGC